MPKARFNKSDLPLYRGYLVTLAPLLVACGTVVVLDTSVSEPMSPGPLLLTLGVLLAGIAGSLWLAAGRLRELLSPLTMLARAMRRLRAGDTQVRVAERSVAEMGDLERGFNVMTEQVQSVNDRLQDGIEQATAELQETLLALEIRNAELDIARKRALDANRIKSDFLANMSHEMRTPMNGIVGFSDLLAKTPLQSQQQEYLQAIRRSAHGLIGIIDNILEYATLDSDFIPLKHDPFSVRETIDSAVQLHVPQAHAKRLEMVALVYGDVPDALFGDRPRLLQILSNLLSNAIKFTAVGEIVLRVMLEGEEHDRVHLGITVTDTGIGIPAREQETLFTAFAQSSLTHKRVFGGAGLGLSLCKMLADAMGGDVQVSSRQDEGSTFTLSLAFDRQSDATHLPPPRFQGQRVLLVEPHGLSRIALRNQLGEFGMSVDDFEALREPLSLPRKTYHLALIGSGSFDQQLQQTQRYIAQLLERRIPVLALVGSSDPKVLQQLRDAGAERCIAKPAPVVSLLQNIGDMMLHRPPPETTGERERHMPLTGLQCLVADDNPINLELLQHYVEHLGGKSLNAQDGGRAIALFEAHPVDIALLDVHMPKTSGLEVARHIRGLAGDRHVPLIALTADGADRNLLDIAEAGFDQHLVKPVTEEHLRELVGALLRGESARRPPIVALTEEVDAIALPSRDREQALRISGGSETVAQKLFGDFLRELPPTLERIAATLQHSDWHGMWHETHKLHGAAAVCAVPALHYQLGQLESAICLEDIRQIEVPWQRVRQAADELLGLGAESDSSGD